MDCSHTGLAMDWYEFGKRNVKHWLRIILANSYWDDSILGSYIIFFIYLNLGKFSMIFFMSITIFVLENNLASPF